jgi:hypothetical protein
VKEGAMSETSPKFLLGRLVATPGALKALEEAGQSPFTVVNRHVVGDWGELDDEDRARNDEALTDGTRLLSAYILKTEVKIWIITEADRSVTTILLPEEY